jgi:hypothetical protein
VDNATDICSKCGLDEALEQYSGDGMITPIEAWPVNLRITEEDAKAMGFRIIDEGDDMNGFSNE